MDTDRDPDLARGGAGQKIRERHELAEMLLPDPAATRNVLLVEVTDVRHRAAERRQPEAERGAEHLARRARDGHAPIPYGRDAPGFQSGSSAPASALAARARMNSRSERRFR